MEIPENFEKGFDISHEKKSKNLILIDDIITTGKTMAFWLSYFEKFNYEHIYILCYGLSINFSKYDIQKNTKDDQNTITFDFSPDKILARQYGRPKIILEPKQGLIYGYFKATHETMAILEGCSTDTIRRAMQDENSEFCIAYKKGYAGMRMKLSEAQLKTAMDGNSTLLIWLGKQYLGQSDDPGLNNKGYEISGFEFVEMKDAQD